MSLLLDNSVNLSFKDAGREWNGHLGGMRDVTGVDVSHQLKHQSA